jgi:predicted glutamine amidotransferase
LRLTVCRYYGLRANMPTRVDWHLVRAPNSLLAQSRRDLSGFEHADGWGIAAYRGDALKVQRRASAAHDGHYFCEAAERVEATTVLAHVRRATVGRIGLANTHPFVHGPFALVHNGTVPYFADIRPRLLDAMTPDHRAAIQGGTDSEHLLHLILSIHAQRGGALFASVAGALRQVVALCREIGQEPHLGLNILLTDGNQMVGSRWRRTLHFLEQTGSAPCPEEPPGRAAERDYRALIIASEPTNGCSWPEVPERSLFEVTPDLRLRIEPLDEA